MACGCPPMHPPVRCAIVARVSASLGGRLRGLLRHGGGCRLLLLVARRCLKFVGLRALEFHMLFRNRVEDTASCERRRDIVSVFAWLVDRRRVFWRLRGRRGCSDALLRLLRYRAALAPHLRTDAIGQPRRHHDRCGRTHRRQPARMRTPRRDGCARLREDRGIELRIRLVLRQTAVKRGDARIVREERFEFAFEFVVAAAHSASFSRIFASA